jgi:hypothetical protein
MMVKAIGPLRTTMKKILNGTFNNISVISWRSVLLVEEAGIPEENHLPSQVTDKHIT